jgi:hypothetical protein
VYDVEILCKKTGITMKMHHAFNGVKSGEAYAILWIRKKYDDYSSIL